MYIDMHVHSKRSDDAGGTVEGYLKWISVIRKKGYQVDGIVLTEHRGFDFEVDYSDLAEQYGVVVLKGAEIETNLGHVLTYGITPNLTEEFDFKNITLSAREVLRAVRREEGYAIAAHPGRPRIGLWQHIREGASVDGFKTIELLNGGSSAEENALAKGACGNLRLRLRRRQRLPLREHHRQVHHPLREAGDLYRGFSGGATQR